MFSNINVLWLVSNGGEPDDQTHILVSFVFAFAQVFMNKTNAVKG